MRAEDPNGIAGKTARLKDELYAVAAPLNHSLGFGLRKCFFSRPKAIPSQVWAL